MSLLLPDSRTPTKTREDHIQDMLDQNKNPLKGKPNTSLQDLDQDALHKIEHQICQFVTYDSHNADSVHNFALIKDNTQCIFAKTATIWGSPEWKHELSLGKNKNKNKIIYL